MHTLPEMAFLFKVSSFPISVYSISDVKDDVDGIVEKSARC